jgi:ribosome recycling factor
MDNNLIDTKLRMVKAIEVLKQDLATLRTGRASASAVENIEVLVYGGAQKLKIIELASITTPDPHLILISPWDQSIIGDIAKGIQVANVGLSPVVDSTTIRIAIPPLSEERRQELVKAMHQKLEAGKVMVRQIRHDLMSEIKRAYDAKEMIEDDQKRLEDELQKLTDEMMGEIESLGRVKEQELMTV